MNICVIDGNSIGYSAHYAMKLRAGEQETQAIYGTVKTLIELKTKHPETKPIVVWDGRAQWRFDRCPSYKSNRHSDDPKREAIRLSYKQQAPFIREILKSMGVSQLQVSTHEADDLAALIVQKKKPDDFITLLTADQDWLQLVRHGVIWLDAKSGKVVSKTNFFDHTGYKTPEAFLDGKCLRGDQSDAIEGVGGIGEKGAPTFLATYGSVQNFFDGVDAGVIVPNKKVYQHLASPEGREIYKRNYEVMQLLDTKPFDPKNLTANDSTSKNKDQFIELCGRFAFVSLMKKPDAILNLF